MNDKEKLFEQANQVLTDIHDEFLDDGFCCDTQEERDAIYDYWLKKVEGLKELIIRTEDMLLDQKWHD